LETPFAAYQGPEPYVFVCYAHEDSAVVYPELLWLKAAGLNLWYDEGISGGTNWRGAIGDSLLAASHVLFYISPRSLASDHCNREISLALDEGKTIVPVYLENTELTSDLKIGLNRVHALYRDGNLSHQQPLLHSLGHSSESSATAPAATPRPRRGFSIRLAAVAMVLISGAAWWYWLQPAAPGDPVKTVQTELPSIAVLPFVNMSVDADQEYFSDGITEEILNLLAKNPAIKVISRSSAFSFKGANTELPLIAERLGVDHVLEGSVRRAGNMVRISVQLIDAGSDGFLWSDTYDRQLDDIFAVQSEIARHVARELNVALTDHAPAERTVNAEAYLLYSQARHLLGIGLAEESSRARELLQQALELDPTFVRAWTELARAHGQHRGREEGAGDKASAATERALTLDPDDPVANAWRGWESIIFDYNFETGVQFYNRSLAMDPTNVDVLRGLENVLQLLGRPGQAFEVAEYVVDRDPLCVICINNLARSYRTQGRIDKSSELYQRSLTLRPDNLNAIGNLAINELLQGNGEAALAWIDQLPQERNAASILRILALHATGQHEAGNSEFDALRERIPNSYSIAMVYAWMGEADLAFAQLEPIVAEQVKGLPDPRSPLWNNLHADPRWENLLHRSGLSPDRLSRLNLNVKLPGSASRR